MSCFQVTLSVYVRLSVCSMGNLRTITLILKLFFMLEIVKEPQVFLLVSYEETDFRTK